jgi:Na+-transporting NADH:ubiquinone oxidoreductase subunit NqrD
MFAPAAVLVSLVRDFVPEIVRRFIPIPTAMAIPFLLDNLRNEYYFSFYL